MGWDEGKYKALDLPVPSLTDLKIKSISTDPEILIVGADLTVNIDVENIGQDINFANHDISIRLIAGNKFGNHNIFQEEIFFDQLSIQAGTTQRISKTFLINDGSNEKPMFMVDAIEVEIDSNDYEDSNLPNKLIKGDILTLISMDATINDFFLGTFEVTTHPH